MIMCDMAYSTDYNCICISCDNLPQTYVSSRHIPFFSSGKLELVKYLVNKSKVDISAKDSDGYTPLELVKHLIKKSKEKIGAKNSDPLDDARQ